MDNRKDTKYYCKKILEDISGAFAPLFSHSLYHQTTHMET